MGQRSDLALQTKRLILAHVTVCRGCCCGAVERGKPEVPVDWMKNEWKERGLRKSIQLTISGCLGPCDLANVVSISSAAGTVWLGSIREFGSYSTLVEWASAAKAAGLVLPLPGGLRELSFSPFRLADSVAS
jgi:hypothetical protein